MISATCTPNTASVFILNIALFVVLIANIWPKLVLLGIPYFAIINPWLLAIPALYLGVMFIFMVLRSIAISKKDAALVTKLHKWQLGMQALSLAAGFVVMLTIPGSVTLVVPEVVRWGIKLSAIFIFFETFRLSFYSIHYGLKAVLSWIHYKEQNIYAVNSRKQLVQGLVGLFTDSTSGWYDTVDQPITMGQERILEFRESILRDLTSADDYQLLITAADQARWDKLLDSIFATGSLSSADRQELNALLNSGEKEVVQERMHRMIRWSNDQLRLDKPRPVSTLRNLLPYAVSMQGFQEDVYFSQEDLNTPDDSDPILVREKTTRLGLIAKYKPAYWKGLIAALKEGIDLDGDGVAELKINADEEDQMRELIKHPRNQLNLRAEIMEYLVPWANTYLADLWNNVYSALKIKRRYNATVRLLAPHLTQAQRNQITEDKTSRIMVKHSGSFANVYEPAFKNLTAELRHGCDTLREYMYYYIPQLRNRYMQGEISRAELEREAETIIAALQIEVDKKKDELLAKDPQQKDANTKTARSSSQGLRSMMEAVVLGGLNATWNRVPAGEQVHMFKWNSLTASLPYSFGLTLDLIDADHHARAEDIWSAPEAMLEFVYNPRLGAAIPVIEHYLAEGFGTLGKIVPSGENAFTTHAQMGKELMGGLTAYGKFLVLTKAMRWSEGLAGDDYVAEDALTVVSFRSFGYECERVGYYRRGKSWMYLVLAHLTSSFKWANDSGESVMGRIPLKMILSGKVSIAYLVDNYWWDGFGFYFKKPHVLRYLKSLTIFYLILDINLFIGLPLMMWGLSTVLSQAISYGSLFNYAYEKHQGMFKGLVSTISDIFTRNLWYFVHWIFVYEDAVGVLGTERLAKFDSNPAKGGTLKRDLRWQDIYLRSDYAVRQGALWLTVIVIFMGAHPYKFILWAFPILMFVAGLIGMFVVNEKEGIQDHWDTFIQIMKAWFGVYWIL